MTETSLPWTEGVGHGTAGGYTDLVWSEFYRALFHGGDEANGGVMRGFGNELAVTGTASPLAVDTGAALVYGKAYRNSASLNLAVTTPVVGTTGGQVKLQIDWTAKTVNAVAERNTDGVASIPALTQSTSTFWEIRLASFTITTGGAITVTDTRVYIHPSIEVIGAMLSAGIVDASTIEISGNALRVKDAGITAAKLAAAIAGDGLSGGAGSALAVNVDGSTLEINADTLRVKDDGITAAKIPNRTRSFLVPTPAPWNVTDGAYNSVPNVYGYAMVDAKSSRAVSAFFVPRDFVSGLTIQPAYQLSGSSGGNLYLRQTGNWAAAGEDLNASQVDSGFTAVAVTLGQVETPASLKLTMSGVAIGDFVTIILERDGAHGSDTATATLNLVGWLVEYTADM